MTDKKTSRLIDRLFAGADAGYYGLPGQLVAARERQQAVADAFTTLTPPDAEAAATAAAVAAIATDPTNIGAVDTVLDARRVDGAHAVRVDLLRAAHTASADHLAAAARDLAGAVLLEHLRPAHDATVTAARTAHATYGPHGSDAATLFVAPAKARQAWLDFQACAGKWEAIHGARLVVLDLADDRPQHDEAGLFARVANPQAAWPDLATSRQPLVQLLARRPWPLDPAGQLAWLIEAGLDLHLPTAPEQDKAWSTVFGSRLEQAQRNRNNLRAFRDLAPDITVADNAEPAIDAA